MNIPVPYYKYTLLHKYPSFQHTCINVKSKANDNGWGFNGSARTILYEELLCINVLTQINICVHYGHAIYIIKYKQIAGQALVLLSY